MSRWSKGWQLSPLPFPGTNSFRVLFVGQWEGESQKQAGNFTDTSCPCQSAQWCAWASTGHLLHCTTNTYPNPAILTNFSTCSCKELPNKSFLAPLFLDVPSAMQALGYHQRAEHSTIPTYSYTPTPDGTAQTVQTTSASQCTPLLISYTLFTTSTKSVLSLFEGIPSSWLRPYI